MRFDFAIYDAEERLVAVFEARAKAGTTADWAAKYRRNLLESLGPVAAPYFGLITPEYLYLWRGHEDDPDEVEPDFVVEIGDQLALILGDRDASPLSPAAFDFLVSIWLNRVTATESREEDDPLGAAGLRRAVRGGHIAVQAAA